ncbi:uncharacterized protein LOC113906218 [Bos indicus x Bos taurus]|uniref:uncharacterized protein LOC113906218 n=1 Tax=Bos indicus x Bos taurus TaxID=30522 RepID=UPI000F7D45B9|nr:uncharacterized protein LOC113906218 [Bos indicus x Bos taurus]
MRARRGRHLGQSPGDPAAAAQWRGAGRTTCRAGCGPTCGQWERAWPGSARQRAPPARPARLSPGAVGSRGRCSQVGSRTERLENFWKYRFQPRLAELKLQQSELTVRVIQLRDAETDCKEPRTRRRSQPSGPDSAALLSVQKAPFSTCNPRRASFQVILRVSPPAPLALGSGTPNFLSTYLGIDSLLSPWDSQLHPQPSRTPDGAHQAEQLELTDALRMHGTSPLQLPPEGSAAPSEEEANVSWRCPCSARQELKVFREFSRHPRLQVHCHHCKPYFECLNPNHCGW